MANDFETINKKLSSIDEKFTNQLGVVDRRLTNLEVGHIQTQRKLDEMGETLKLIPKLYNNVDKFMGEILENRLERTFFKNKLDNHEKRISKLELKPSFTK